MGHTTPGSRDDLLRGTPPTCRPAYPTTCYVRLTESTADRFAAPEQVAAAFYALAYKVGVGNLPEGVGARQFVRDQLDRLGLGEEVTHIPWGSKRFKLPPSRVRTADE